MVEGLSLARAEYHLDDTAAVHQIEGALKALCELEAVESVEVVNKSISVQFYPEILSRESIRRELDIRGVLLSNIRKPGNPFKRFVDRLGESNTRNFGTQPLDCCNLNRKGKSGNVDSDR
jgi:hypothetical protein